MKRNILGIVSGGDGVVGIGIGWSVINDKIYSWISS